MQNSAYEELIIILNILESELPRFVDGKEAILEMRREGSRNWRQMEWIGFWFEHFVEQKVIPKVGAQRGPTYGTTEFDLQRNFVWDLKAHPLESRNLILNDQAAIKQCIQSESGLGFIVISGQTQYDDASQSFKIWHDAQKGGSSESKLGAEPYWPGRSGRPPPDAWFQGSGDSSVVFPPHRLALSSGEDC